MTLRSFAACGALAFGLVLTGCDGAPGGGSFTCEEVGLSSRGALSATAPTGTVRATCFEVFVDDLQIEVSGLDIDLSDPDRDDPRRGVEVVALGTTAGTYVIGATSGPDARAVYFTDADGRQEAVSGTVVIEEVSDDEVRGAFAFETADGVSITDGTFDVDR